MRIFQVCTFQLLGLTLGCALLIWMRSHINFRCGIRLVRSDLELSCTRRYYRGIQGVIIFYDASSQNTFDNVPYWIEEARKYGHSDVTLMLVGTKCDCSEKKVVTYETAKEFADENDILFFEVSARDETNIEFAVLTLVAEIRRRHCEHELTPDHSVV